MVNKLKKLGVELLKKDFLTLDPFNYNYLFSTILLYNELDKKERKNSIKNLKKTLNLVSDNFHEDYLLISNENEFKIYDNLLFLELFERLIEILEENKLNKFIDKINDIKLKLDLGFARYFLKEKNSLILNFNLKSQNFSFIDNKTLKTNNNNNISNLIYFLNLKIKNKKLKFDNKLQKYFPEFIYKKKDLIEVDYLKSLFFDQKLGLLELKKEKVILQNINNINVIILVLTILKDDE